MSFLKRRSDETESRPIKRPSNVSSATEPTSKSASDEEESEYEEERRRSSRRHRNGVPGIGRTLVKRRRGGRSEVITPRKQAPVGAAVTPPSTSSLEEGLESGDEVGEKEEDRHSQMPARSSGGLLKWNDMPYPGLPQIGYAFSYASGPIHFIKVPASASKSLAAHWRPPQNYVAYVIYSLHPLPDVDNKRRGLDMVNELAARGFIEDDDCDVHEETIQGIRALSFQKGDVVVSVPKLGGARAFRGYRHGSKMDEEDRKMILDRLQSVMHDRAFLSQTSRLTSSPNSARCTDESRLRGTTMMMLENDDESSGLSGKETSLMDSGLIKFVKVHWRQSKWIEDNIHLIRATQHPHTRASSSSDDTWEQDANFRAVIVWSNKRQKKEGLSLLEAIIAARLAGSRKECMKDVMSYHETVHDGELWVVYHKNDVVVGFPGEDGENEFLEGVQAMEHL